MTPDTRSSSIETSAPLIDPHGPSDGNGATIVHGSHKFRSTSSKWLDFALFSIGGVAAAGLVVVLFGAYLIEPPSSGVIVVGTIVLLVATIAWIITALVMIGDIIWKLITSRGSKSHRLPPHALRTKSPTEMRTSNLRGSLSNKLFISGRGFPGKSNISVVATLTKTA